MALPRLIGAFTGLVAFAAAFSGWAGVAMIPPWPTLHGASYSVTYAAVRGHTARASARDHSATDESRIESVADIKPRRLMSPTHPSEAATNALHQYIAQHSDQQLRRELKSCRAKKLSLSSMECPLHRRRFAIGYYSCPQQAGNRLHHFMTGMAWAAVTNRTLFWKYYDKDTCKRIGNAYDWRICENVGTRDDCEKVLELASWIPSHEEWAPVLGLSEPSEISFWSTHPPPHMVNKTAKPRRKTEARNRIPFKESDERYAGIDKSQAPYVHFGQLLGNEITLLEGEKIRTYLLHTEHARLRAKQLLAARNKYLYGLIFTSLFSFGEAIVIDDEINREVRSVSQRVTTIAVHSRHAFKRDVGLNISLEVDCLKKVLKEKTLPCAVYIISDRPKSLVGLQREVSELKCTAIVPPHSRGLGLHAEHGPYAGVGFFQDLAVASHARDGLVGSKRSSTMLLEELITFHRMNDEAARGGGNRHGPFQRCIYDT